MSDTNPAKIPTENDLARAELAFKRACARIADFEQPEREGWALFNIPENPTRPEDFLTMGIEMCVDSAVFDCDEDAYRFVFTGETEMHARAIQLHGLADIIRLALWGDTDRRTPPDQDIASLPARSLDTMPCNAQRAAIEMAIEEDDLIGDWIAEARVHAEDMPAVIQRDYLLSACKKLESNAVILSRLNTLYDAIAHGDEDHRGWLEEAINAHMNGEDVPAPRGQGGKVYTGADNRIEPTDIFTGPAPDLPRQIIIVECEQDDDEAEGDEIVTHYLRVKDERDNIVRIDFPKALGPVTSVKEAVTASMNLGYSPTHYIDDGHGPWPLS